MSIVRAFILDIPPVTRSYIFGSVILTGLVSLNVCGDTEFFYNYSLIFHHGQVSIIFNIPHISPSNSFIFHCNIINDNCVDLETLYKFNLLWPSQCLYGCDPFSFV